MQHNPGFNRNIMGGTRRNKGITKYGKCKDLSERLILHCASIEAYRVRVKNQLPYNILITDAETGKSVELPG